MIEFDPVMNVGMFVSLFGAIGGLIGFIVKGFRTIDKLEHANREGAADIEDIRRTNNKMCRSMDDLKHKVDKVEQAQKRCSVAAFDMEAFTATVNNLITQMQRNETTSMLMLQRQMIILNGTMSLFRHASGDMDKERVNAAYDKMMLELANVVEGKDIL